MSAAPEVCDNEQKLLVARRDNFANKLPVLQVAARPAREGTGRGERRTSHRLTENLAVSDKEAELVESMVKRGPDGPDRAASGWSASRPRLRGQLKLAEETIKRIEAAIMEAKLQVDELGLQLQQEALDELTQALAELSVVDETIRGASDRVARTDIRSPVDGIVNTLELNTIGAFVQPGAVVAGHRPDVGNAAGRGAGFAARRRLHPAGPAGADQDHGLRLLDLRRPGRQGGQHHGRQPGRPEYGRALLPGAGGDRQVGAGTGRQVLSRSFPA